ncbi:MAG: hypothetical protein NVSMB21_22030 [Vulcanimicrobiaceae bacterium]
MGAAPSAALGSAALADAGKAEFTFLVPAPVVERTASSVGLRDVAGADTIYLSLVSVNGVAATNPKNLTFAVDASSATAPCKSTGPYLLCRYAATEPVGNDVFAIAAYRGLEPISYNGNVAGTVTTTASSVPAVLDDVLKSLEPIAVSATSSIVSAAFDGPAGPPSTTTNGQFLNAATFSDVDATGMTGADVFFTSTSGSRDQRFSRPPTSPTVTIFRQPLIFLNDNVPAGKTATITLHTTLAPYTIPASRFPQARVGTIFTQPATAQSRSITLTCTASGCVEQPTGSVTFPIS